MENKSKTSGKIKSMFIRIICVLIFIGIIGLMTIVGINLYIKATISGNILTEKEAADINADCILVLGAGVRADGTPSWMLEDRIIVADELYNLNASEKILMSGDHGRNDYDEVNTMKNYAVEAGVPSENIFMDHAGFETYDSVYRAKEIFGAKKIIIVSQKYHLYRALYIADKLGIEAYGVPADLRGYSKKQYYRVAREWLARVKTFGKCISKAKPKYLGDKIDLNGSSDVTNDK